MGKWVAQRLTSTFEIVRLCSVIRASEVGYFPLACLNSGSQTSALIEAVYYFRKEETRARARAEETFIGHARDTNSD